MISAFEFANDFANRRNMDGPRYQFQAVWTDGEHSDKDPGSLLPEGLRWLWSE